MNMKTTLAAAAIAGMTIGAGTASATVIDFGGAGGDASSYQFDAYGTDDLTVTPGVNFSAVNQATDGLGVDSLWDGGNDELSYLEALRFTFDQEVRLGRLYFTNFDPTDDYEIRIIVPGMGIFNDIYDLGNTENPYVFGGLVADNFTIAVIGNDSFRVGSLQIAAVPVPAAGFLLVGALGGLAALRRKRKAA